MRTGTRTEDFETFARLQSVTRGRQGSADYPSRFFPAMARRLAPAGLARAHLCQVEGETVAGVVALDDPASRYAYYGYGASVEDRVIWRKGVNQIALWTAMREALDRGAERFSFGSTPAFQTSLREYKERFGGVSAALPHTAFGLDGGEIEQDGLLVRIGTPALRRMPVQLYRRFSPLLLREVV